MIFGDPDPTCRCSKSLFPNIHDAICSQNFAFIQGYEQGKAFMRGQLEPIIKELRDKLERLTDDGK